MVVNPLWGTEDTWAEAADTERHPWGAAATVWEAIPPCTVEEGRRWEDMASSSSGARKAVALVGMEHLRASMAEEAGTRHHNNTALMGDMVNRSNLSANLKHIMPHHHKPQPPRDCPADGSRMWILQQKPPTTIIRQLV